MPTLMPEQRATTIRAPARRASKSEPWPKEGPMKQEDKWMIAIVIFSILFTASFGWGVWG